jgi:amino acid transporter
VWLAAVLSFILALPSLGSTVAFAAATSIATIGLYISYGLPIMIGLIWHDAFNAMKGPFNLGVWSRPIAAAACAWIATITIAFCLPALNPVTDQTVNYSVVAVGIIAIGSISAWLISARKWFTGPRAEVAEAMRLGVDVTEPGALEGAEVAEAKKTEESKPKEEAPTVPSD